MAWHLRAGMAQRSTCPTFPLLHFLSKVNHVLFDVRSVKLAIKWHYSTFWYINGTTVLWVWGLLLTLPVDFIDMDPIQVCMKNQDISSIAGWPSGAASQTMITWHKLSKINSMSAPRNFTAVTVTSHWMFQGYRCPFKTNLLPQGVIYVPSVRLLSTHPPSAAQRHQFICWIGIFLQQEQLRLGLSHSLCNHLAASTWIDCNNNTLLKFSHL